MTININIWINKNMYQTLIKIVDETKRMRSYKWNCSACLLNLIKLFHFISFHVLFSDVWSLLFFFLFFFFKLYLHLIFGLHLCEYRRQDENDCRGGTRSKWEIVLYAKWACKFNAIKMRTKTIAMMTSMEIVLKLIQNENWKEIFLFHFFA